MVKEYCNKLFHRLFPEETATDDIAPLNRLYFYSFFYLTIIVSGYMASRAGHLPEYGGGQWLFYAKSLAAGGIPFQDYYLDYGPLMAYSFWVIYELFGENSFAVHLGLNLIFPLIAFIFYHIASREIFYDYRFRYGFLLVVWLLNLHVIANIPAISVPL
ncbi:MAG: hypothetical protein HQK84_07660, partial [Nitrospinae bacterium]|nr:hypothetical protein [Nitrospinota bacterium]